MSKEIERKFLLSEIPLAVRGDGVRIQQGYLTDTGGSAEVRVRAKGDRKTLGIKVGAGMVRTEVELSLTDGQFSALWPATEQARVVKVRNTVALGPLRLELDFFEDSLAGLVMAEIEFDSEAEAKAFTPPEWLGREVTSDIRYQNRNLAHDGIPPEDPE